MIDLHDGFMILLGMVTACLFFVLLPDEKKKEKPKTEYVEKKYAEGMVVKTLQIITIPIKKDYVIDVTTTFTTICNPKQMKTVLNIIKRYLELKREEVENRYKTFRIPRPRPITRNKRKHIKP